MAKDKLKKIKVTKRSEYDSPTIQPPAYLPSFRVGDKQMPEIRKWTVGEKYRLVIEVLQTSQEMSVDDNGISNVSAGFDIVAYKYLKAKTIDEMNDEEFEEYQGESLAKGELV